MFKHPEIEKRVLKVGIRLPMTKNQLRMIVAIRKVFTNHQDLEMMIVLLVTRVNQLQAMNMKNITVLIKALILLKPRIMLIIIIQITQNHQDKTI